MRLTGAQGEIGREDPEAEAGWGRRGWGAVDQDLELCPHALQGAV